MIKGEDGVAGFFEDLPVLMFVLVGVSVLVITGTWVAGSTSEREAGERLHSGAHSICQRLLGTFESRWGSVPRMESLAGVNLSSLVDAGQYGFVVTVLRVLPEPLFVNSAATGDPASARNTGFASVFMNAGDAGDIVNIVEVRVIVWQE